MDIRRDRSSAALSLALVVLAPGFECSRAAAAVISTPKVASPLARGGVFQAQTPAMVDFHGTKILAPPSLAGPASMPLPAPAPASPPVAAAAATQEGRVSTFLGLSREMPVFSQMKPGDSKAEAEVDFLRRVEGRGWPAASIAAGVLEPPKKAKGPAKIGVENDSAASARALKAYVETHDFDFSTDYPSPGEYKTPGSQARGLNNVQQPEGVKSLVEWLAWARGQNKAEALSLALEHAFNLLQNEEIALSDSLRALEAVFAKTKNFPVDDALPGRALEALRGISAIRLEELGSFFRSFCLVPVLRRLVMIPGAELETSRGLVDLYLKTMALESKGSHFVEAAMLFSSQKTRDILGLDMAQEFMEKTLLAIAAKDQSTWSGISAYDSREVEIKGESFVLVSLLDQIYLKKGLFGRKVERTAPERAAHIRNLFAGPSAASELSDAANRLKSGFMYVGRDGPASSDHPTLYYGGLGVYPSDVTTETIELDYRGPDNETGLQKILERHGLLGRLIKSKVSGWDVNPAGQFYWVDSTHVGRVGFIQAEGPEQAAALAIRLAADPDVDGLSVRVHPLLKWRAQRLQDPESARRRIPRLISEWLRESRWDQRVMVHFRKQILSDQRPVPPGAKEALAARTADAIDSAARFARNALNFVWAAAMTALVVAAMSAVIFAIALGSVDPGRSLGVVVLFAIPIIGAGMATWNHFRR